MTLFGTGCSIDSAKNHYVLAEKLWTDRNYSVAVSEFEKVISKDPKGKLGLQATYRAAMTQYLFLGQYNDAIRKFQNFVQSSTDLQSIWDAQLQIGEILFAKTDQYDRAILHYDSLLKQRPESPDAPEFTFRIAKSYFYLFKFKDAIAKYKELIRKYPQSPLAEKAMFEIGTTYFTRGEGEERSSISEAYQEALDAYRQFLKVFPKSRYAAEAQFGIACCLEELDQLDEAYHAFHALKSTYPAPNVIEIKLIRIRERLSQRKRYH